MSKTETPVSQLKINRLTKTQFDGASDLSETELYAVDPEFTGGKLLKTDSDGNIVESTLSESTVGTVTSVNNVQPVNGNVSLTIPTVNNATLTIQKNGTSVATFTANSSTNTTANITVTEADTLPSQTGQSGKYLTTNGTSASWGTVDALPSQSGQSGKFLTTNGTTASWDNAPTEIPSQSGQSGKYLTTNGTSVSWSAITIPTVNNATLTIQKNGTSVGTFTANASSNVTANITVPTDLGDLTNNAGYTKNVGTVTSVNNVSPVSGNVSLTIPTITLRRWS